MTNFQLQVRQFAQNCVFDLSWGRGQKLSATLTYPESLTVSYTDWQRTYLNYYKSALRGRKGASGSLSVMPVDWHTKLVQAEAKLLSEFHQWLRSAELFEIRAIIANSHLSNNQELITNNLQPTTIRVFLTCHNIELEYLPWETWEMGADFPKFGNICLVRTPVNIRQETEPQANYRKKARILVILGDETGLNFHGDRQAVGKLERLAEIEFMGWQPGQDISELKAKIAAAIASEKGWDVLLFAGHSNETEITGGELAIAPHVSISIREIAPQLQIAKAQGLKFALFNSCSGLSLATSLIDLGLSQVAVMREPIHNAVAEVFLVKFMQELAEHKDVRESLLAACQSLKVEKNLTYPSTYLIPSLFCHPDAQLYRIPNQGFKQQILQILPTVPEAIAIAIFTLLSLSLPLQHWLLANRVNTQAVYRQLTGQISPAKFPPVLLVQIDEQSLQKADIYHPQPMNRNYLASLIDQLTNLDARVVGIDYILTRPYPENEQINHIYPDRTLAKSLKAAVQKHPPTTFVFAAIRDEHNGNSLTVVPQVASSNWSLNGQIYLTPWYMSLVPLSEASTQKLPFSYLLALVHKLQETDHNIATQPQLNSQTDFLSTIKDYLQVEKQKNYQTFLSSRANLQPLTAFSYYLGQMWLHPIIDFSIPPQQVYQTISAWQLLEDGHDVTKFPDLKQQIIIIAPGGYLEAQDNFPVPAALEYWFAQTADPVRRTSFTGGEIHAYMIDHFLNRRLVLPIPDLWLIVITILFGKIPVKIGHNLPISRHGQGVVFLAVIMVYGLVSLQVYISAAILLPWVLPTLTWGTYILPALLKNKVYGFYR